MKPDFPIALARDGSYDAPVVSTGVRLEHHDIAAVAPDIVYRSDGPDGGRHMRASCGSEEMSQPMTFRLVASLTIVFLALGLSPALAQGAGPGAAQTEQDGPFESLGRMIGLRPQPSAPADFVRDSRPAESNFIPVHSPRPNTHERILTNDELQAKERELDALKASHDKLGNRPATNVAHKPLQAPAPSKVAPATTQQVPQEVKLTIPETRR